MSLKQQTAPAARGHSRWRDAAAGACCRHDRPGARPVSATLRSPPGRAAGARQRRQVARTAASAAAAAFTGAARCGHRRGRLLARGHRASPGRHRPRPAAAGTRVGAGPGRQRRLRPPPRGRCRAVPTAPPLASVRPGARGDDPEGTAAGPPALGCPWQNGPRRPAVPPHARVPPGHPRGHRDDTRLGDAGSASGRAGLSPPPVSAQSPHPSGCFSLGARSVRGHRPPARARRAVPAPQSRGTAQRGVFQLPAATGAAAPQPGFLRCSQTRGLRPAVPRGAAGELPALPQRFCPADSGRDAGRCPPPAATTAAASAQLPPSSALPLPGKYT